MSDFNYPESKGPKDADAHTISSFLNSSGYKNMGGISPSGTEEVMVVTSDEKSLGEFSNKEKSI